MAGSFAHGTVLTVGSAIAELTSISGPTVSADTIDVTTHDSANGFREFVGGLRDGGEITVEGNLQDQTESDKLYSLLEDGTVTSGATIDFPTSTPMKFTFDCIVTSYEPDAPHDGALTFSATLKVTGKPTLSVGDNVYTATFAVEDGVAAPVEDAIIYVNNEVLLTDVNGEATIDLVDGSYPYTVAKDAFVTTTGTLTVSGANTTESVTINAV